MNLDLHKEFAATFEKYYNEHKRFTIYWSIQNFFEYLQDKGIVEIKPTRDVIRLNYKTSVSNLFLKIHFYNTGEVVNLSMGYSEADEDVCVWEFYRWGNEEGFHNWFEDPENANRFPTKRKKPVSKTK